MDFQIYIDGPNGICNLLTLLLIVLFLLDGTVRIFMLKGEDAASADSGASVIRMS